MGKHSRPRERSSRHIAPLVALAVAERLEDRSLLSDISFAAARAFDTGSYPYSVAIGDFNGNGKLDLAVANQHSNTVSILKGNGDGTFAAKVDYATGASPYCLAVGDFNGDGKLDLAVANSAGNSVSILKGNGDGTFAAKVDYATGASPYCLAVGDFNGDGKLDLAVANSGGNSLSILKGNGDGTFAAKVDYATGASPVFVAAGDFNGDGKLDLAVANSAGNTVSILRGNGDGTFAAKVDYVTGWYPYSVAVGDFNGDGKLDLAVANQGSNTVSILRGNGDGTFAARVDYAAGGGPYCVAAGDFNGDEALDLAVANYAGNTVDILKGNGDGTFAARVDYATGGTTDGGPTCVVTGDFNGDGKLDLAVANYGSNSVSILTGTGNGAFAPKVDYATGSHPVSVATGDFNGDGKLDLAVANEDSDSVSILMGHGDGTFAAKTDFTTHSLDDGVITASPDWVAVGDFNSDGKLDLAVANYAGDDVSILMGHGDGTFAPKVDYHTNGGAGSSPYCVAVGDFNGDGKLDLAVANIFGYTYGTNVSILQGNGDGSFAAKASYGTGLSSICVVAGDFNGDGKLDLAVANKGDDNVSILRGNGDGTFAAKVDYATGDVPYSIAVGDFNGDGKLDLAVANQGSNTVSILQGNGDGTFAARADYATGSYPYSVAVGDFNADGKPDLAIANYVSWTVSVLLTPIPFGVASATAAINGSGSVVSISSGQQITGSGTLSGAGGGPVTYHWEYSPVSGGAWTALSDRSTVLSNGAATLGAVSLGQPAVGHWLYRLVTTAPSSVTSHSVEVDVAAPPANHPPTAVLSATTISRSTTAAYRFKVDYRDNGLVKVSTLGNKNLQVTGPKGYKQMASLVGTSPRTNASTVVATYSIPAPRGLWNSTANGTYTVWMCGKQVSDTTGLRALAGSLGKFSVAIAR
ncbi:MAG: VCBS repeat-containing protein [Tepidisphaeraceae bacterium]